MMRVAPLGWEDVDRALRARAPRRVMPVSGTRSAVAVILRPAEASPAVAVEILLVRRAEDPRDPWSGHMAFPGGRFEVGDRDLCATAVRETREETGIDLEAGGTLLGELDEIRASSHGRTLDLSIAPFVFRWQGRGVLQLSGELSSAHWLALDVLDQPQARATLPVSHEGRIYDFPCLRIEGRSVWGLTYRMLVDLAERLGLVALPRDPVDPNALGAAP